MIQHQHTDEIKGINFPSCNYSNNKSIYPYRWIGAIASASNPRIVLLEQRFLGISIPLRARALGVLQIKLHQPTNLRFSFHELQSQALARMPGNMTVHKP